MGERPGGIDFPSRCVVPFAKRGGAIAVTLEHFRNGDSVLGPDAGVARLAVGAFGDGTKADLVSIPSGQQGRAGGGTQSIDVKVVITQALIGQAVNVGVGTGPPKTLDQL